MAFAIPFLLCLLVALYVVAGAYGILVGERGVLENPITTLTYGLKGLALLWTDICHFGDRLMFYGGNGLRELKANSGHDQDYGVIRWTIGLAYTCFGAFFQAAGWMVDHGQCREFFGRVIGIVVIFSLAIGLNILGSIGFSMVSGGGGGHKAHH